MKSTFFCVASVALLSGSVVHAQQLVDIRILNVTTVDATFNTEVVPQRDHDGVHIRVDFEVVGGTAGPFDISATLDNCEVRQHFDKYEPGRHTRIYNFAIPVEDSAEAKIVLDPDGTSGDSDKSNNSFKGRLRLLTPFSMPAFARANPIDYIVIEKLSYVFDRNDAGKAVVLKMARIHNTATVQVVTPDASETEASDLDSVEHRIIIGADGHATFERHTKVSLANTAVNPAKLEKVAWDAFAKDPITAKFTKMSEHLDGNSETVQRFVDEVLGADYRKRVTPFTASKMLFRAIKSKFSFQVTDSYIPSKIIQIKAGQCASGARLMCALLRNIGIPARTAGGFWLGQSGQGHDGHRICEFYFPNIGWIPCDATPDEKPHQSGNLNGFANQWRTNRLWVTWADDTIHDCGVGPAVVKGPNPLTQTAESSLQRLDGAKEKP